MPKLATPLTAFKIQHAKTKDKTYYLSDGLGLSLAIQPNGKKCWYFRYTKPTDLKRTKISLGQYPYMSLSDARDKREQYIKLLHENIDPQAFFDAQQQSKRQAQENTLLAIALKWKEISYSRNKPVSEIIHQTQVFYYE